MPFMLLFMHVSVPEYIQDVPQPPTDQREFLTLMKIFDKFPLDIYANVQRPLDMYVNLDVVLSIYSD